MHKMLKRLSKHQDIYVFCECLNVPPPVTVNSTLRVRPTISVQCIKYRVAHVFYILLGPTRYCLVEFGIFNYSVTPVSLYKVSKFITSVLDFLDELIIQYGLPIKE